MDPIRTYRSLRRTRELAQRIAQHLAPLRGACLVGERYDRFLERLSEVFGDVPPISFSASTRPELGRVADDELIETVAKRLAAAELRVRQRRPVPGWRPLPVDELVPVAIEKAVDAISPHRGRELGAELTMRAMAGTAFGHRIVRWYSLRALGAMARARQGGADGPYGFQFARVRRGQAVLNGYEAPRDFTGLRCLMIVPANQQQLEFREVRFDAEMVRWNREVQKFRARDRDDAACPFEMPLALACRDCPVGRDRCRGATHVATYVEEFCRNCRRLAYFDKLNNASLCVGCARSAAFKT